MTAARGFDAADPESGYGDEMAVRRLSPVDRRTRREVDVGPDGSEDGEERDATILPFPPEELAGGQSYDEDGDDQDPAGPRVGDARSDGSRGEGPGGRRGLDWSDEPDGPVGTDPVRSDSVPETATDAGRVADDGPQNASIAATEIAAGTEEREPAARTVEDAGLLSGGAADRPDASAEGRIAPAEEPTRPPDRVTPAPELPTPAPDTPPQESGTAQKLATPAEDGSRPAWKRSDAAQGRTTPAHRATSARERGATAKGGNAPAEDRTETAEDRTTSAGGRTTPGDRTTSARERSGSAEDRTTAASRTARAPERGRSDKGAAADLTTGKRITRGRESTLGGGSAAEEQLPHVAGQRDRFSDQRTGAGEGTAGRVEAYGQRRLPQRVPQPVPPRRTDPPYLAVTIDATSPDAATAARRHRRDRLFAIGVGGKSAPTDEEVIMDAAGQSAEFGEWAEGTNVGETTLEQLADDVRRISRDYLNNPPLPLMLEAIRVRNRVFTLLEGRQHPEQSRQLYLTAGRLCGLLAWMASDVGRHAEADTQARTAWLCAELAGADGLHAWVRAIQSKVAYWDGRLRESAQLAGDGLRFAAPDAARVMLASLGARAWARLGAADEAHAALHTAEEERERAGSDEVGGLLGFSEAQQSYMAGSAHLWLKEPQEALAAADRAIWLFDAGGQSVRFYGAEMLALVDAAAALTQSGELDGAAERLRPVLELPPEQQLDTFTSRLAELRDGLRRSRYAMSKPAVDMQRQIEEFRSGALGQILSR